MGEFLLVGVLLLLGMGAYWAFILLPRQRDFTKRQLMVRNLAEGDEIITAGGIIGKVREIHSDQGFALVEIAEGTQVRVVIAAMLDVYDPQELAKHANMGQGNQNEA